MPSEARTFAPGDEVTVSAKGFEAGDDIMLRIAWPLTNAAISEGYADGVWGVVTSAPSRASRSSLPAAILRVRPR